MAMRKPRAKATKLATPTPSVGEPRRHRPRPTPSWLLEQQDLDEIARRRCLMVLSVLSGETAVTDAITSANISRQMYYLMEERALRAMLRALTPGAETTPTASSVESAAARRIAELEAKLSRLEQDKRRSERLLMLTRKVLKPGPMTTGARGRPPRARPSSTSAGLAPSPSSPKAMKKATPPPAVTESSPEEAGTTDSTPKASGDER